MARRIASARVFGSKPGAYGAGLQALIDEGIWETGADFARELSGTGASYAYGAGARGPPRAQGPANAACPPLDAILHNQDNREHDILDSDDYYQFEGGLAATGESAEGPHVRRSITTTIPGPSAPSCARWRRRSARVVRARAANPKWIAGRDAPRL